MNFSSSSTPSCDVATPRRLNSCVLRSALVSALGGLLFGFDTAVISGATEALARIFALTEVSIGFTVAVAIIGTVFGSMLAGVPGERYGARECLKVMGILFFVSSVGCGLAWSWESFMFFRLLGGLAIGGSSVLGPVYIAEVSPAKWRGRLVGCFQFNVVAGILLAYLSNYLVGLYGLGEMEWRMKLGIGAVPSIIFFFVLFSIPRSPRWLVRKGHIEEAREVLVQVGEDDVEGELKQIAASIDADHGHADEPLFSRKYRFPLFLAISIAMFNQLSGINGLLYYLNDIFAMAGFTKVSGDLQAVAIGGTNLLFTVLAMTIIDKVGRRVLLMIGSIGTALSMAGVAAIFFTNRHQELLVWMLVSYIAFFAFSQGAVIWVYISEVFPNRVRAKGQALGSFTHWAMCGMVSFSFPLLAKSSGGYPFVFFSAMMLLQFFVVLFIYPETKGISLEGMQKKLGIK